MNKEYAFPVPGCRRCPHHQTVGAGVSETRYCAGFKGKEPRRFRKSDPVFKAPKWCPRRISPPVCRIHGFKDERSAHMDSLWREEYRAGRMEAVSPSAFHYGPKREVRLGMTAGQFFETLHEDPLRRILPEEVHDGEIIEIDDGLRPWYFYVLDPATVVPLPYFRFTPANRK